MLNRIKYICVIFFAYILFNGCIGHNSKDYDRTVGEEVDAILFFDSIGFVENIVLDWYNRSIYKGNEIVRYFGKLPIEIIDCYNHYEDLKGIEKEFYSDISALESYAKGKLKDYPYESVLNRINIFCWDLNMLISEGYDEIFMVAYRHTFNRYADIALRLCPDLHGLASFISDDGRAGVIEIAEGWYQTNFSLMLFKDPDFDGYRFEYNTEDCIPSKVIRLPMSKENDSYYLFYSDPNIPEKYWPSRGRWIHSLVLYNNHNGNYNRVNCFDDDDKNLIWTWRDNNPNEQNQFIIFSPDKCKWNFCTYDGKYYHVVPGTTSLVLDPLEGKVYISK